MKKYVGQINSENFVYPNNTLAEYDVDIIHDINNNSVTGTVLNLQVISQSSGSITFSYQYSWSKNGAEVYLLPSGQLSVLSVHLMGVTNRYYKPWRIVDNLSSASTGATSLSGTRTFTVLPADVNVASFTTGYYYFEFRMIGHRAIYPIATAIYLTF
jgi:hypothetical protein